MKQVPLTIEMNLPSKINRKGAMRTWRHRIGMQFIPIMICVAAHALATRVESWQINSRLQTVAEQSDFRATAPSAFVVDFLTAVSSESDHISHFEFGRTFEGRPMMAAMAARPLLRTKDDDGFIQ